MRPDIEILHGAIDIHIHPGPDLYARHQDSVELARTAQEAGLRAVCLKCHNFPTAQTAVLTQKEVPGIDVFGSLVCNLQVGGLNPIAVETAIKYGARQIYLPTIDSENHVKLTGGVVGQHGKGLMIQGGLSEYTLKHPRINILDREGNLLPQVYEIIKLVAEAGIILNAGHISFEEMKVLIPEAKKQKVQKLVVDHPFFSKLSVAQQQTLAEQGAFINFTAGELLPRWWRASVEDFANALRQIGPARSVLSTDCGQLHNPQEVESLRIVCQLLLEEGLSEEAIRTMLHRNPGDLLYP
jgi:hypothetical protein